jgi:translocation and assembly module TamA
VLLGLLAAGTARAQQVDVEISGVNNGLRGELMDALTLTRQKEQEHLTLARVKALFGRARKEIRTALEARGYYQAQIQGRLTEREENRWAAAFRVEPGPRTHITNVSLELAGKGKDDKEMQAALDAFPLKTGDPLNQGQYEDGKKHIEEIARERGYFDATWSTHAIKVDVESNSARIDLQFDTGPRYRFGEVSIPDTVVSADVIQRLIPFQQGDPYDANLLITLSQTLRDSDYFEDVLVTPQMDAIHDRHVPLTLTLTPRPRNSYSVGGGFGTDTGPRLVASWDVHYVNRKGHRTETDLRLSPVLSSLTGSYILPYFHHRDAQLGVSTSLSHENTNTHQSNTIQAGTQYLTKLGSWNQTLGLTYQYESFNVAGVSEQTHLLMPSVSYWKTKSDDPIYTLKGYRLGLDVRGAVEGVVSGISFLQAVTRAKIIHALGKRGRVIARGEFGGTMVSDFKQLPASLRFFAGGDNSVRGFDYQALGPKDSEGNVIGGRYKLTGSLEYEYRFLEKWSGAVFTDIGNAFNSLNHYELEYSVGAGIHWLSPVGLIRVDVAAGISRDDVPIRLHIVVGPDL